MYQITAFIVAFCVAFSLSSNALADNHYSMDKKDKDSGQQYTLGDLAAARLAVYGILDERFRTPQAETSETISRPEAARILWKAFADENAPSEKDAQNRVKNRLDDVAFYRKENNVTAFRDVPEEYGKAVEWVCRTGIAQPLTAEEFGVYPVSETMFVSMLLNAAGYADKFEPELSLKFAESIGLAPVGLSRHFTLGDAALYLQKVMEIQTPEGISVRERMNIPDVKNQSVFPKTVVLTPLFPDDVETQIQETTRYLADTIIVRGDYLTPDELYDIYVRYNQSGVDTWYSKRL